MDTMDDAGVFKISKDVALVQSIDFFYPIVNDPVSFGRIVAANSLSDVWAMGAKALTAMNMLAYPAGAIPPEVIELLLRGGSEKLKEAGVSLVGGHTMEQEDMVYGMSVTGVINPEKALTNANAHVGDKIVLTKPLGTGVMANALSQDALEDKTYQAFVDSMERLNIYAAGVVKNFDIGALTDVTGFGLLGHALPLARNSGTMLTINTHTLPILPQALHLLDRFNSTGCCKTREFVEPFIDRDADISSKVETICFEAQTSGGLLITVCAEQADDLVDALKTAGDTASTIIGEVHPRPPDKDTLLVHLTR